MNHGLPVMRPKELDAEGSKAYKITCLKGKGNQWSGRWYMGVTGGCHSRSFKIREIESQLKTRHADDLIGDVYVYICDYVHI